ncbi:gamma-tubulin complex component 6 [Drosophila nasuta]|uniref:gamma-tubulin complex component 6 n=1 Tax=Drosophila nasuta TaxID=42062 RepID=UPI00295E4934|nr:gamma-tubulin complex component 6 [Drosophila nasuta]
MAASFVCNHSIFKLISKLAELQLQDERAESQEPDANLLLPATAEVSRRRAQIYEVLLRGNAKSYFCDKLDELPQCSKLLNDQSGYFDAELITDITHCLQNISFEANGGRRRAQLLLLRLERAGRNTFESQVLLPEPLRLKRTFHSGRQELYQSLCFQPTVFRSIPRSTKYRTPRLLIENGSNSYFTLRSAGKPIENCLEQNPYCSAWRESVARFKESKTLSTPLRYKLPLPAKPKETIKKKIKQITRRPEKHFFSDLSLCNEINWHRDRSTKVYFIELPLLIDHLKKVSVGLQSETFLLTPDGYFFLRPHRTVKTLLPNVLADYAQPFLDAGRAYLRLCFRTQWDLDYEQIERPMNRTMRHAIIALMSNSRTFLLSQPAKNLSELLHSATPTMRLLQQIDQMFQNEPSANIANGATGASLLSVVWSEIDACVNIQYLQILMYLLRLICETYYRQLQRWLYEGELDEPFNELFISSTKGLDEQSKEFFDKGFKVHSNMVPGFLAGNEQAIVQCGKYSRLLKRYNAQNALFRWKPPNLSVCLTEEQLTNMQNKLKFHYKCFLESITPFSMQSMLEERTLHSHRFGNRMWSCTQERIADWEENQRELLSKANEGKQRRYAEFNNERKEEEESRLEQRRQEIVAELMLREKCEQQNEVRLQREKLALEKQIATLQQIIQPSSVNVVEVSPDGSSSSGRSFVSCCEELSSEAKTAEDLAIEEDSKEELEATESQEKGETGPADEQNSNVLFTKENPNCQESATEKKDLEDKEVSQLPMNLEPSDVQNSNALVTEIDRNRQRNISSGQFLESQTQVELRQNTATQGLTDAESNRLRVLNCTDVTAQVPADETTKKKVLTDAESNRLRVLNCTELTAQLPTDVNMNVEDLSELQRNRQRMLHHQHFDTLNGVTLRENKTVLHVEKDSESNLKLHLPLEPHKLFVEPTLDTATPMSTTSDIEIELCIPKETIDAANNNVNAAVECKDVEERRDDDSKICEMTPKKLPKNPEMTRKAFNWSKPVFQLHHNELSSQSWRFQLPKEHNPFLIKRYVEQSILLPLDTHLSLLRNEVLRIFDDLNVYEHFCQLRNYFFLLDGEFGTALVGGILERIEAGMEPRSLCQKGTLDMILKNALGRSATEATGAAAVFVENLTLICSNIPESFDLMNIDVMSIFTLDCKADWPLNLVISVETMQKYTHIFSYLLKLRHVSFMLERTYQHLQELSKLHGKAIHMAPQYRHLQLVRRKLSHFVLTLQNHLETNALQGTWRTFNDKLRKVETVEELYQRHVEYVKQIVFISLLNRQSAKFRNTIDSILVIVLRFCKILHSKSFVLDQNQEFIHPRYKRLVFEETEFEKFMLYVIYLGNKIDASGYNEKIVELISIINFNNYYNITNGPKSN